MQRRLILDDARQFYNDNVDLIKLDRGLDDLCQSIMHYLESKVRDKGFRVALYRRQFDYMVNRVNEFRVKKCG